MAFRIFKHVRPVRYLLPADATSVPSPVASQGSGAVSTRGLPGAAPPLDTAGLSSAEAARRLAEFGRNELRDRRQSSRLRVLWNQLRSPLLLLLLFAAGTSALVGEWVDASIVLAIVLASVGIGYSREYRAQTVVAAELAKAGFYRRSRQWA